MCWAAAKAVATSIPKEVAPSYVRCAPLWHAAAEVARATPSTESPEGSWPLEHVSNFPSRVDTVNPDRMKLDDSECRPVCRRFECRFRHCEAHMRPSVLSGLDHGFRQSLRRVGPRFVQAATRFIGRVLFAILSAT